MSSDNAALLVPVDSKHEFHTDMFKTLDLLSLTTTDGPIYFIIQGCAKFCEISELNERHEYFYEEGQCPTNFIRIEAIFTPNDDDPHGLFTFIRSVWLTTDYLDAESNGRPDEWLRQAFPETIGAQSVKLGERLGSENQE
jgi:hypothetical protein